MRLTDTDMALDFLEEQSALETMEISRARKDLSTIPSLWDRVLVAIFVGIAAVVCSLVVRQGFDGTTVTLALAISCLAIALVNTFLDLRRLRKRVDALAFLVQRMKP